MIISALIKGFTAVSISIPAKHAKQISRVRIKYHLNITVTKHSIVRLTCHRDNKRCIHGVDAKGSGTGRQVEIGDEVGQLAEDQRPSVNAEEGVL